MVLFNPLFPSANIHSGHFCNGQCKFENTTWQSERANQLMQQTGSRHRIPGSASQLITVHSVSTDLFQSQVFESVHLH